MLTYLFRAYFADGSVYEQTPEDTARHADHGSAYTDVEHLVEQGAQLVVFALVRDGVPVAAVHLEDGHFELGGNEFYAGWEALGVDAGVERRLVYFRNVARHRTADVDTATGESVGDWREETHTRYVIGWQATVGGRNVQHLIALDG